jgi:hypothetical protein
LGRPLGYAADVVEGEVDPSGPLDAVRGVVVEASLSTNQTVVDNIAWTNNSESSRTQ